MRENITTDMITAGIDATLLYRGKEADLETLVVEIYRAMEFARRNEDVVPKSSSICFGVIPWHRVWVAGMEHA